jgi:hypothetical protein
MDIHAGLAVVRSGGSPLPLRPLRSFLALAVDPSPNFGGGVHATPGAHSRLDRIQQGKIDVHAGLAVVRSGGSPLPLRPLRSFLALAVDPSPNFGGGVHAIPGAHSRLDRIQQGGKVIDDLVIREAQRADAVGEQGCVARGIAVALLLVHRAVELDAEPLGRAVEVEDESADGVLPAELVPVQPPGP